MKIPNIIVMDLKEYQFEQMQKRQSEQEVKELRKSLDKEKQSHNDTHKSFAKLVPKYLYRHFSWDDSIRFENGKVYSEFDSVIEEFEEVLSIVSEKYHNLIFKEYERLKQERE